MSRGLTTLACLQNASERVSRLSVYICGGLLIFSAVLVAIEVVLRKAFNESLASVDELSGYIFAITTAWAFSFALFRRAHIRIDALYVRLPPKVCCVLDVLAMVSLAVLFSVLVYLSTGVLQETLRLGARANTPLGTPLWIPQSLWLAGLGFFCLNIYLLLARSGWALLTGNFDLVRDVAGAPSIREEVEAELHQVEETQFEAPSGKGDN
jgi:TRAP-type C4-dicarboxylate transport system permease small subunit